MIIFTLTVLCVVFWATMFMIGLLDALKLVRWLFRMFDRLVVHPIAWVVCLPIRAIGRVHGR